MLIYYIAARQYIICNSPGRKIQTKKPQTLLFRRKPNTLCPNVDSELKV